MYATDFEEDDLSAIEKVVEIALPYEATIQVIHFSIGKKDEDDTKMAWFKELVSQKVNYEILHMNY